MFDPKWANCKFWTDTFILYIHVSLLQDLWNIRGDKKSTSRAQVIQASSSLGLPSWTWMNQWRKGWNLKPWASWNTQEWHCMPKMIYSTWYSTICWVISGNDDSIPKYFSKGVDHNSEENLEYLHFQDDDLVTTIVQQAWKRSFWPPEALPKLCSWSRFYRWNGRMETPCFQTFLKACVKRSPQKEG